MSTVREAVKMMNNVHLHPQGFHLFFVREDLLSENPSDVPHNIMKQTYDWRFGKKPDKEQYTLTLSAADMEYLGNALEVYHEAIYTRYIEPDLENILGKLGGTEI